MNDDRTPRKIACEMVPLICKISNAYNAAQQARPNSDTVCYILGEIHRDADDLKRLVEELYLMTHPETKPALKAVE